MLMNRTSLIVLFAAICAPLFLAKAGDGVDGVTVKDDKTYAIRGDKTDALTTSLSFPDKVEINTNGMFKVADGKERKLETGQVLRPDGWLLNLDGSAQPVVDHLGMKEGRAYVVRDGQRAPLQKTMVFPNGMSVNPDGYGGNLPGARNRLLDGQLFRLDGTSIPGKDTVIMKNGRVVLQKDGSQISLAPVQVMIMSDGTQVRGDGYIQKRDGSTQQMREGQIVLVEGAIYGR
jgi:hypothetical protein